MTARERLAEIKARAQAATEGPWEAHICGGATDSTGNTLCEPGTHANGIWSQPEQRDIVRDETGQLTTPDAAFIAHARTDIPRLVAALEAVLEFLPGPNDPCPLCTCIHVECEVLKAIDTALDGAS